MSKVIIIGAGGVGGVVTHKCAQLPEVFSEIILASRNEDKCKAIAAQLDRPIRTAQIDADNVPELTALLEKEKPDLVINVALPYQDLHIMDACLAAGVDYLDTANYEPLDTAKFEYSWQWAYREKFENAGLMALLGSGFDPGATNVFTAYLAKHYFDEIHELDIIDVNGGDHGYPFATNFNPEINIREVTAECRHWENGEFVTTPAMSKKASFTCPEEVGNYNIYRMYHEELESLVVNFPTLKRAQFWMSFGESYLKHLEVLGNVGMTGIDPIDFNGQQIVPIQFLKALLPDPSTLGPRTKGKTCIGCVVKGVKDGKEKIVYLYQIKDHQDCYAEVQSQAISYTTGVPAMIGAKMMLEGKWKKPGVWNIEQFDPDPFMEDMNKYGLPWEVIELDDFNLDD
ncbi:MULTISPECIES: saccharopine dehydrogenase family protein [unclassified Methylophaga]|jgi:saccharopine dehydrogenase (NAD+, L-lysine-forming)|uniref:saccharopine dehydrogenase family protein n=1 Tax=unclassified Methylophaga TaxID=2629249 RepID=UPI000C65FDB4|nr:MULTISPECIES: saccharopine dehydrogenase family protein [unclassified Methylophaga]MAL50567.1 saccharopine dehydrogenase [Methylophaga sp.]MBP25179.1 saccharopine dehydrogenase [Methylophaga sp.]MDX1749247.1 saccharopine dehydrogenase family protein [Methylophaga sp.]HCC82607.1 saccharopine dehydrogenase [Methylophaga sp.]|tara:strand:- start:4912 stop:6111 length:1200 start_codon:yes stop_codon:yes gene_type:complete